MFFYNEAVESPLWNFVLVKVDTKGFQMTLVPSKSEDTHIEKKGSEKGVTPLQGVQITPITLQL